MSPAATNAAIPLSRQSEKPGQSLKWIGKSMKRVEDPRLLTGQGRYIDDIDLPNMLHAAVLRSSRPHAKAVKAGAWGAPPAVCSAIEDAPRPFGVKIDALPVTPRRLRTLIREAQARAT